MRDKEIPMATATSQQRLDDRPGLREQTAQVKEDIREFAGTAGDAAREQVEHVEEYIKRKPLTALLMAGGVGLVMGFVLRR
jgi:ElaB/YqjD/DUF883 family membrane-anchored ribosome-binding protein